MSNHFRIEIEKISYWRWDYSDIPDALYFKFIFEYNYHSHVHRTRDNFHYILNVLYSLLEYGGYGIPFRTGDPNLEVTWYDEKNIKFFLFNYPTYDKKFENLIYGFITLITIEEFASAIKIFYDDLIKQMDEKGIGPPEEREKFIKRYESIFQKYEEWKKKRGDL